MNSPFKFLTAIDIVTRSGGDVSYIRALTACRNGEIPCQKQGNQFIVYEHDADAFIAKCREQNDPELVGRLKARIADLEYQLSKVAA